MKTRSGLGVALTVLLVVPPFPGQANSTESKLKSTASLKQESAANRHMHQMDFMELVRRFEVDGRDIWQKPEEVIDLLGNINGKTVLDLGAGTGYFSIRLARHGARVIAADVDERFLGYIRQRVPAEGTDGGEVTTRLVGYNDPGLAAAEADAVLMVDVYHHIERRPAYFTKLRKGMKPGGSLLIVDFHPKKPSDDGPPVHMRVAPRQVEAELRKAGFKHFEWRENWLAYQYVVVAR
jgi:cyclopropane fatty-acyl-phospholipid synthase-like methyltransferase